MLSHSGGFLNLQVKHNMNRFPEDSMFQLSYANIRSAAGLNSKVLFRMNNGQKVDTTGNKIHRDGYDWYEIYLDNDQYGWIAGHFIGY